MSFPARVLILGASGQVGVELQRSFAGAGELIALDRNAADLSQPQALRGLIRELKPQIILNAAAYTAVDRAESEPELAMAVNGEAPGILAEEAAKIHALLVHYSTDYVFDGTKTSPWVEDDTTNPLNVYGQSKLAGEHAIQSAGGRYLIFRTSWVYGPHGRNFMQTMLRLGAERDQLRIVGDQHGAPTSSIAIADATYQVVAKAVDESDKLSGIYHLSCSGETTWHGFASSILAQPLPGKDRSPEILPIRTDEYPLPARRPQNSVLSNQKLHHTFQVELPSWQSALDEVRRHLAR